MPPAYSVGEFADELGVHRETVKRWCRDGDLDYARTPGGDRRIPERELRRLSSDARPGDRVALYARVAERGGDPVGSDADAADEPAPDDDAADETATDADAADATVTDAEDELGRQLDRLADHATERDWDVEATYADVGSGLDDDRDGLQSLLDDVPEADYGRVLVAHDATLARHGGAYLDRYLDCFGVSVTALEAAPEQSTPAPVQTPAQTPVQTTAGDRGQTDRDAAPGTDDSSGTDDPPPADTASVTGDAETASDPECGDVHSSAHSSARALEALLDAVDATLQAYAERDYDANVEIDRESSPLDDEVLSIVDRVDDLGKELRADAGGKSPEDGAESAALAADPDLVRRLASLLDDADRSTAAVSDAITELEARVDEEGDCADAVEAERTELTGAIEDARAPLSDAGASTERARERAADGRGAVGRTTELLAETDDATERTQDALAELQSHVAAIDDVAAAIDDIADETHVLALNAQIEAARADHRGAAGFGVVAEEVKSLAADARANAAEIEGIVDEVQVETARTADGLETTRSLVAEGLDAADDAAGALPAVEDAAADAAAELERAAAALEEQDAPGTAVSSVDDLRERLQEDASDLDAIASTTAEVASIVGDAEDVAEALASARPERRARSE